jgi:hypothetical protein
MGAYIEHVDRSQRGKKGGQFYRPAATVGPPLTVRRGLDQCQNCRETTLLRYNVWSGCNPKEVHHDRPRIITTTSLWLPSDMRRVLVG